MFTLTLLLIWLLFVRDADFATSAGGDNTVVIVVGALVVCAVVAYVLMQK